MNGQSQTNVDPAEVEKFAAAASRWWDPEGEFGPLHKLNPVRMQYIIERVDLRGKRVLDVGCGGGLLSESLAAAGAHVTAIDVTAASLDVARLHGLESGITVDYRLITVEALALEQAASYDIITCMEMLEHVPDPLSILDACARLLKPGGRLFLSTINRNPKSWLMAIVGAEYILGLLPRGTHDYNKLIRPSELAAGIRRQGLQLDDVVGLQYNPARRQFKLTSNVDVNYLACSTKPV